MSSRVWCDDPCRLKQRTQAAYTSGYFILVYIITVDFFFQNCKNKLDGGVETLPRTACYLMSGSLFSLRVVLNAESGALRSQNTPGGHGSLAFSGEAR